MTDCRRQASAMTESDINQVGYHQVDDQLADDL